MRKWWKTFPIKFHLFQIYSKITPWIIKKYIFRRIINSSQVRWKFNRNVYSSLVAAWSNGETYIKMSIYQNSFKILKWNLLDKHKRISKIISIMVFQTENWNWTKSAVIKNIPVESDFQFSLFILYFPSWLKIFDYTWYFLWWEMCINKYFTKSFKLVYALEYGISRILDYFFQAIKSDIYFCCFTFI